MCVFIYYLFIRFTVFHLLLAFGHILPHHRRALLEQSDVEDAESAGASTAFWLKVKTRRHDTGRFPIHPILSPT